MQDKILQSIMYELDPKLSTDPSSATEIPVDRVPGGTISFIFEKLSTTIEKENDSEPGDEGLCQF